MRKLFPLFAVAVMFSGFTMVVGSEDGKKVMLEGMAQCAKCALKVAEACQSVLVVEEDGEETQYFLEMNEVAKKTHVSAGFCTAKKDEGPTVKVEGTVEEKDDKLVLTPTSIEKVEE